LGSCIKFSNRDMRLNRSKTFGLSVIRASSETAAKTKIKSLEHVEFTSFRAGDQFTVSVKLAVWAEPPPDAVTVIVFVPLGVFVLIVLLLPPPQLNNDIAAVPSATP
jgi:hypothetical protein